MVWSEGVVGGCRILTAGPDGTTQHTTVHGTVSDNNRYSSSVVVCTSYYSLVVVCAP